MALGVPLVMYLLRLILAPPSTAAKLRRWLLVKAPLPASAAPAVVEAAPRKAITSPDRPAGAAA
jgi:hypothetical protein